MLTAGETRRLEFALGTEELGSLAADGALIVEPGQLTIWVGGASTGGSPLTPPVGVLAGAAPAEPGDPDIRQSSS